MNIVVFSDIETRLGGRYYYDLNKKCWFGHWSSNNRVVNTGYPKSDAVQEVLTKIAIKNGYPRSLFRKAKSEKIVVKTQSVQSPSEKKKRPVKKKQKSTFISLF